MLNRYLILGILLLGVAFLFKGAPLLSNCCCPSRVFLQALGPASLWLLVFLVYAPARHDLHGAHLENQGSSSSTYVLGPGR